MTLLTVPSGIYIVNFISASMASFVAHVLICTHRLLIPTTNWLEIYYSAQKLEDFIRGEYERIY